MTMENALYIVATPIGNLGDITLRALEVLKSVDVVFAEDTRVTRAIFNRYEISTPLKSYREAADRRLVERMITEIVGMLHEGKSVAFVSDAGTPGVSDPGDYLVSRLTEQGLNVVPIPGASALAAILSVAGLSVQRPLFIGFLPKKKGHQTLMGQLKSVLVSGISDGIVLYESPERIIRTLQELLEWEVDLQVCLGRELTKQFEEILRGTPQSVLEILQQRKTVKGEIVLLVSKN